MADWYKASLGPTAGGAAADGSSKSNNRSEEADPLPFASRRSPVLCRHACVATSQPLASSIGLDLLRRGANAAEVAVAVASALAVAEPCSTGLGGDMFCLYYSASSNNNNNNNKVTCINGSGASPADLTLELLQEKYPNGQGGVDANQFRDSPHSVTVPGAAQGWQDLLDRHGSGNFTLAQLLEPAAVLAEEGFPVAPITAHHWTAGFGQITKWLSSPDETVPLCKAGTTRTPPAAGDIVINPDLARVLRDLGQHGAQRGFYQNPATAGAIVDVVQKHGGCLTRQDLAWHTSSTFPEPISADYRGCRLWQVPPNGQGIAGLIALSGLRHLEDCRKIAPLDAASIGTADAYHVLVEMMRLGFADSRAFVADPASMTDTTAETLLDASRIGARAERLFDAARAAIAGAPDASSCTVSFQVVDRQGNAISFVNSNFMGFGTGLVPAGCGFTLQNRGFGFALDAPPAARHPNGVAPNKRPYHTIIPGMLTHADTGELYATLSNMGGNMQPQGHLQLTVSLLAGRLDPQAAIDLPRFCIADGTQHGTVFLEDGVEPAVVEELERRGHRLRPNQRGHDRSIFGRAQIIKRDRATNVLWAGSDGRSDGCAIGF